MVTKCDQTWKFRYEASKNTNYSELSVTYIRNDKEIEVCEKSNELDKEIYRKEAQA
ncbi:MAG: hypothetical protein VX777_07790 [Chlamydiota bacterium]|nr:hypothetical protein [Chlamydiota bacterium]